MTSESKYGIKIIGTPTVFLAAGVNFDGEWIETFDYDVHAPGQPYPTGSGTSTSEPAKAMAFDSPVDAWEAWRRPSTVTPLRPDGKPNRPMTIFTVVVEALPC